MQTQTLSDKTRNLFAELAPSYDVTTTILSAGTHLRWRKMAVAVSGAGPGQKVLDVASGTGALALMLKEAMGPTGQLSAVDFCDEMLQVARKKAQARKLDIDCRVANAHELPFEANTFDLATNSFGIRCVEHPEKALREMARVVKPGGRVMLMEFGQPYGAFGMFFRFYSAKVMPWLGTLISGSREAYYDHLPNTSASFPAGQAFVSMMEKTALFKDCRFQPLSSGTAYIYTAGVI